MNEIPEKVSSAGLQSAGYCVMSAFVLILTFLLLPTFFRGLYFGKEGLIPALILTVASVGLFIACPKRPIFGKVFTLLMMVGVIATALWTGLLYEGFR